MIQHAQQLWTRTLVIVDDVMSCEVSSIFCLQFWQRERESKREVMRRSWGANQSRCAYVQLYRDRLLQKLQDSGEGGGEGACYERDITTQHCPELLNIPYPKRLCGTGTGDCIYKYLSLLITPYLESNDNRNVPVLSLSDPGSHQIIQNIIWHSLSFISLHFLLGDRVV